MCSPRIGVWLQRDPSGYVDEMQPREATNIEGNGPILRSKAHAGIYGNTADQFGEQPNEDITEDWWLRQYADGANLYQYIAGNCINHLDPSGRDIWIEDADVGDQAGHQRIAVGKVGGQVSHYSFGLYSRWQMLCPTWWRKGFVYRDPPAGQRQVQIQQGRYLKTTAKQDADFKAVMDAMVGQEFDYGITEGSCRTFVRDMMDLAIKSYGPPPPPPPPALDAPFPWHQNQ